MKEDKYFIDFGVSDNTDQQNNMLQNLYKKPRKEAKDETPHFMERPEHFDNQADLLFLPEDNDYKYCLVVTDVGSRLCDAVPLKTKSSEEIIKAFNTVYYKNNILKFPTNLITFDSGSEFKNKEIKNYFKDIDTKYAQVNRHRQVAIVERTNQRIGTAIMKYQTAQELLTKEVQTDWVEKLPEIIQAINVKVEKRAPKKQTKADEHVVVTKYTGELIPIGTEVRIALEFPENLANKTRMPGKFRDGDHRWGEESKTVTDIVMIPSQPPMYVVDHDCSVNYTKNQLQVVPANEKEPPAAIVLKDKKVDTFVVKQILDSKVENKKKLLLVWWLGYKKGESTWEPYKNIQQADPKKVKEYEKSLTS